MSKSQSQQVNIRLDAVHLALLDEMVKEMKSKNIQTSRTDVIQKAIYTFAQDVTLDPKRVSKIIDDNYRGLLE